MMILTGLVTIVGLPVVACLSRGEFHLLGACIGLTAATICDLPLPQGMATALACAALIGQCAERLLHLRRKLPDHAGSIIASIDAADGPPMPLLTGPPRQWPASSASAARTDPKT